MNMKTESADSVQEVQEGSEISLANTLQEMWSMQREVLKEMISGFRRLEQSQVELKASVTQQFEAQLLDERFQQVNTQFRQLEDIRTALGGTETSIQSQLKETQDIVFNALVETGEAVQVDLQERLERLQHSSQSNLTEVKAEIIDSLQQSLVETQHAVEETLRDAASRTEEQTAGKLDDIAKDLKHVHELRKKVEKTLDELSREVSDVGMVAGRLESSTILTQELLDEQRVISSAAQQRETRNEARSHNNAGVLCYHQGAYDSSVEHFKKALKLDASMSEAYNNLGLSYTEMGDNDGASDAFRKALELDPTVGQVYNNLGYLYHRRGDLEHAVEMYQRAIQRSTDTSAAYSNLGNALYQLKRVDESVTAWKKAVEVDPSNQKAAAALERLGLESPGS